MAANSGVRGRIRSFSSSNLNATEKIHVYLSHQDKAPNQTNMLREVTKSSMIIPTFQKIPDANARLTHYTLGLVADVPSWKAMEEERVINWCPQARTLVPFNTDPDGNCLLHSISIYIWGVHDRKLILRKFLDRRMKAECEYEGRMYLRWKNEQERPLNEIQLRYGSVEFRRDWKDLVKAASCVEFPAGNAGMRFTPLEDIHVFALCNIVARPIIVLSEKTFHWPDGRSLQPNQISGIYLPLLRDPSECERSPIIIGYHRGHFLPLLSGEDQDMIVTKRQVFPDAQHCVPLVYSDLTELPIRFSLPTESRGNLLTTYMECGKIPVEHTTELAVFIKFKSPPAWSIELMWSLFAKARDTYLAHITSASQDIKENRPNSDFGMPYHPTESSSSATGNLISQWNTSISTGEQIPISSGYRLLDGAAFQQKSPTRKPCIRCPLGCTNTGEERYNMLCKECHEIHVLERKTSNEVNEHQEIRIGEMRAELSTADRVRPQEQARVPAAEKCIIFSCQNRGRREFHDMCRGCYNERLSRETGISTFDTVRKEESGESKSGKKMCATAGCQDELIPGTDQCAKCSKKLIEDTSGVNLPTVYPGFNKIPSSTVPIVSSQGNYERNDTPYWQSVCGTRLPENTVRCKERYCEHFAAPDKEGFCNECYGLKLQFHRTQHQSQKCVKPGCPNSGEPSLSLLCQPCYFALASVEHNSFGSPNDNDQFVGGAGAYTGNRRNSSSPQDTLLRRSPTVNTQERIYDNIPETNRADIERQRKMYVSHPTPVTRPDREPLSPEGGLVNQGYEAGLYTIMGESQEKKKCIMADCTNEGREDKNGLCDRCHQQSVRQEQMLLEANQARKERQARAKVGKLPADSPYLNPTPCKAFGCRFFVAFPEMGYCEYHQREYSETQIPTALGNAAQPLHARDPVRPEINSPEAQRPASASQGRRCTTKYCTFYASGEYGPFCSKCFMEQTKKDTFRPSPSGDPLLRNPHMDIGRQYLGRGSLPASGYTMTGDDESMGCRRVGCRMYGRPETNGYCSQCYSRNIAN